MFKRFTERARRVIILAREEAERHHHEYLGTEHILLGMLKDGGGIAITVLPRPVEATSIAPPQSRSCRKTRSTTTCWYFTGIL